jgi:AcrR family transcriptional regulator
LKTPRLTALRRAPKRCATASACSRAARAVFSAGGPDASLEAVAETAGVGIGTLYRHFPTREALFDAVYRHEAQQLPALADRLKKEAPSVEALDAAHF